MRRHYRLKRCLVVVESWPPVTFGRLKIESSENQSSFQNREDFKFLCKNSKKQICEIDLEPELRRIVSEISRETISDILSVFVFKFSKEHFSESSNRIVIQFGQLGDEDQANPGLTGLELNLMISETEENQSTESDLVRFKLTNKGQTCSST